MLMVSISLGGSTPAIQLGPLFALSCTSFLKFIDGRSIQAFQAEGILFHES
jgi:hypothetical protein